MKTQMQVETELRGGEPPSWWRSSAEQLRVAARRWPNVKLPVPPAVFEPRTSSEVLLLHVPERFSRLWARVPAPENCDKVREYSMLYSSARYLKALRPEFEVPVWVAFDPEHATGVSPKDLSGRSDLACSEVLSALIQFPNWVEEWDCGYPEPLMSGYRHRSSVNDPWKSVPFVTKKEIFREFSLDSIYEHQGLWLWASPTVREV